MKQYTIEGPFLVKRWRVVAIEGLTQSVEHDDCHTEKEARDFISVCEKTDADASEVEGEPE